MPLAEIYFNKGIKIADQLVSYFILLIKALNFEQFLTKLWQKSLTDKYLTAVPIVKRLPLPTVACLFNITCFVKINGIFVIIIS